MKMIALPDDLEQSLHAEAIRRGMSPESIIRSVVDTSMNHPALTVHELKLKLEKCLAGRNRIPVRIELLDGSTVVIDTMQQCRFDHTAMIVNRRNRSLEPEATRIEIGQIASVIPFDELPAMNGALSYREFHRRIQALLHADPFQAFEIVTLEGRSYDVNDPATLLLNGRFCSIRHNDDIRMESFLATQVQDMRPSSLVRA